MVSNALLYLALKNPTELNEYTHEPSVCVTTSSASSTGIYMSIELCSSTCVLKTAFFRSVMCCLFSSVVAGAGGGEGGLLAVSCLFRCHGMVWYGIYEMPRGSVGFYIRKGAASTAGIVMIEGFLLSSHATALLLFLLQPPLCLSSNTSVLEVAKKMADVRADAAILLDGRGHLEGIVSDNDVARCDV